jgi:hypothetical protein
MVTRGSGGRGVGQKWPEIGHVVWGALQAGVVRLIVKLDTWSRALVRAQNAVQGASRGLAFDGV